MPGYLPLALCAATANAPLKTLTLDSPMSMALTRPALDCRALPRVTREGTRRALSAAVRVALKFPAATADARSKWDREVEEEGEEEESLGC